MQSKVADNLHPKPQTNALRLSPKSTLNKTPILIRLKEPWNFQFQETV